MRSARLAVNRPEPAFHPAAEGLWDLHRGSSDPLEGLSDLLEGLSDPHRAGRRGQDRSPGQVIACVASPDALGLATPGPDSSTGSIGTWRPTLRIHLDGFPLSAGGLACRPTAAPVAV